MVWRCFALLGTSFLVSFDIFYVGEQFFMYYHHWSILGLLVSFFLLFWDSIFHLTLLEFLPAFKWLKEEIFMGLFFKIDGFSIWWQNMYSKYTDLELYEKFLSGFHDFNAIFFEVAFS